MVRDKINGRGIVEFGFAISVLTVLVGVGVQVFYTGRALQRQLDIVERIGIHVCRVEEKVGVAEFQSCLVDVFGKYNGR